MGLGLQWHWVCAGEVTLGTPCWALQGRGGQEGHGVGQRGPCSATTLPCLRSSAVESKSTVSILDDIGSMFDDLADQLDAMLE